MSEQFSNDTMMDMFVYETTQLIEQLEGVVLKSETDQLLSEAAVHEIFRIMHTMKGSSAMMLLENITTLAHAMEELFYYIREEKLLNVSCSVISDIILACVDFIKIELAKIKNGITADGDNSVLLLQIDNYLSVLKQKDESPSAAEKLANTIKRNIDIEPFVESVPKSKNIFKAVIFYEDDCQMENIRAFSIIHNLRKSMNEIFYYPSDIIENESSIEVIRKEGFRIYMKTENTYDELQEVFQQIIFLKEYQLIQLENEKELQRLLQKESGEETKTEADPIPDKTENNSSNLKEMQLVSSQQSIISVSVTKLDKLMDLVGEMVIAQALVIQNSDLNDLVLNDFRKAARQLGKISDEIQDMVMAIRMVPLSTTFHKMNRIVRDMCKRLGKEVTLEIIGEETEVDKNIIEHISDPLMHLVRNSIDHGIELPEIRNARGKPMKGVITLEAKNAGRDVIINIQDDGQGLDKNKILKKARENNLLNKPETEMTDHEIYNLILLPGFSTREEVTEYSGRGVGMDVVLKNIEAVGGSVLIDSIWQQGTVITLKIPLTLAIIDGMNIKVGNSYFTIPTVSIKEFFRPEEKDLITDPDGNEMIMVRGQCYRIIRLYEFYRIHGAKTSYQEGILIMVEQSGSTLCILADQLIGQQQVVVKTLPEYVRRLKKVKGLAGCTLLGNGSISLILDSSELYN